jgi:hypothetical protein
MIVGYELDKERICCLEFFLVSAIPGQADGIYPNYGKSGFRVYIRAYAGLRM